MSFGHCTLVCWDNVSKTVEDRSEIKTTNAYITNFIVVLQRMVWGLYPVQFKLETSCPIPPTAEYFPIAVLCLTVDAPKIFLRTVQKFVYLATVVWKWCTISSIWLIKIIVLIPHITRPNYGSSRTSRRTGAQHSFPFQPIYAQPLCPTQGIFQFDTRLPWRNACCIEIGHLRIFDLSRWQMVC